ncbi:MAG: AMP-binding protein [Deltaproteobacteria bacterium]|nr:MAG: AMP-binding protein [Deltaproteobacteria bacterium]
MDANTVELAQEIIKEHYGKKLWPNKTLSDFLSEAVAKCPDKVAIVYEDRRITFKELQEEAEKLAAGLVDLGLKKGDMVTVQIPNWPEMCFYTLALARIGAVIQPMHIIYREREMEKMLGFCESTAVVIPSFYREFDYVKAMEELWPKLPQLKYVIVIGDKAPEKMTLHSSLMESTPEKEKSFSDYLQKTPLDANDIMFLNFTSGTEGDPKGFLHTHNTLLASIAKATEIMESFSGGEPSTDIMLCHSPMTHTFGHLSTHQVAIRKVTMVFLERYSPEDALKMIEKEKVTNMSGTPAHLIGLLTHPDFKEYDLSSLKSIGSGGAACPVQLIKEINEKLGCKVSNAYGLGENILHTITMPFDPPEAIFQTVGRPMINTELRIYDEKREKELPQGEAGEIAFRGPTLFVGYFKKPDLTKATRNEEGWFFTGDVGFIDPEGCLRLAGRKKEMINRGGTKIFPLDVENLIHSHPKVERAAVLGMPDYRLGEKVCAYVVPRAGEKVTFEEIVDFLKEQKVMKLKIPERVEFVSELPLTPTGKVLKRELEKDIAEKLKKEEAK